MLSIVSTWVCTYFHLCQRIEHRHYSLLYFTLLSLFFYCILSMWWIKDLYIYNEKNQINKKKKNSRLIAEKCNMRYIQRSKQNLKLCSSTPFNQLLSPRLEVKRQLHGLSSNCCSLSAASICFLFLSTSVLHSSFSFCAIMILALVVAGSMWKRVWIYPAM